MPTAWLPWPGKTNATVIGRYLPLKDFYPLWLKAAKDTGVPMMSRHPSPIEPTTGGTRLAILPFRSRPAYKAAFRSTPAGG
jgi:hypothetical protein